MAEQYRQERRVASEFNHEDTTE